MSGLYTYESFLKLLVFLVHLLFDAFQHSLLLFRLLFQFLSPVFAHRFVLLHRRRRNVALNEKIVTLGMRGERAYLPAGGAPPLCCHSWASAAILEKLIL